MDNNQTELGYAAIHTALQTYFFGQSEHNMSRTQKLQTINDLEKYGLTIPDTKEGRVLPELPPGYITDTHRQFETYQNLLKDFVLNGVPEKPKKVNLLPGWYRYCGEIVEKVPNPLEQVFIIDCETLVKAGGLPLMASAVSNEAWYFWLSPHVVGTGEVSDFTLANELIPVGSGKLIINFFVKFDSKLFQETYEAFQRDSRNYFFDLMSAHIAVCGMSGKQRELYILWKQGKANYATGWATQTSPNSLMAAWEHHYQPSSIPQVHKELRNIFVEANTLQEIRDQLETLAQYTLLDVQITQQLATALIPKYIKSNPSPLTLGGHLILNSGILPVSPDWYDWLRNVETTWLNISIELKNELGAIASSLVQDWLDGKLNPDIDPWLSTLDWEPAKTGINKGLPAWYRKARKVVKGVPSAITMKSQLAPILLRIKWKDSPVRFFRKYGWVYTPSEDSIEKPEFWCEPGTDKISVKAVPGWIPYDRIPHPQGDSNNCGSPLGKDYIKELDGGFLSSDNEKAKSLLEKASAISYWTSARERVMEQKPRPLSDIEYWGIDPSLLAHGTSSRRCVEALWLTTCQPKKTRVGSETLSKITAPPGYKLVGCDFDTQEVKIASLEGEAYGRGSVVGSTAMGYSVILGNSKDGTDPHSMVAKPFGVSRQVGKTINFAAIYLAGVNTIASSIKAKNPQWSEAYCKELATKALARKRGTLDRATGLYHGGTDSESFNFMLTFANHKPLPYALQTRLQDFTTVEPRTPLLKSSMSLAINPKNAPKDFLTTRANWCVQSVGVDLLGYTLCIVDNLSKNMTARFVLARHDEVWFLVADDQVKEFARVLQIASVTVWASLARELGFSTLPENYAWFSGVNVDYCIRKEPIKDYSTETVSNPVELPYGYVLTPTDIFELK